MERIKVLDFLVDSVSLPSIWYAGMSRYGKSIGGLNTSTDLLRKMRELYINKMHVKVKLAVNKKSTRLGIGISSNCLSKLL